MVSFEETVARDASIVGHVDWIPGRISCIFTAAIYCSASVKNKPQAEPGGGTRE